MEDFLLAASSLSPRVLVGAGVCSCFVAASWVLNRWPGLVWKTKRIFSNPPRNIAHRGGQAERSENTILAFSYAVNECNCRMIELDVWMTKDKELVVAHDDDIERVTGKKVLISNTNYADLPPVLDSDRLKDCHMEFVSDFGGFPVWFPPQPLPRLEDVFAQFPDTIINVDIKAKGDPESVYKTLDLVRKYNRVHKTVFGSFDQVTLKLISEYEKDAIVCIGPNRAKFLVFAYYTGLMPFVPIPERVWEFPICKYYFISWLGTPTGEWERRLPSFCAGILRGLYYLYALASFKLLTNPNFVAALKRRGLVTFGWVTNTTEEFSDGFYRVGCDGLMTDRPALMAEWLRNERLDDSSPAGKDKEL
ncbi:glycerophosphoryl diester phosphodiesterase protein [Neospora caninum Liverpool]|uniref:Glycerophosphoryl diester phosphodiesterase protein n=1 Tax=Neospora caninum (strain Liverpool) TaxID=572307 RepID=F0VHB8_NEOCL|nr:glycerophosphoryl diester phosphodiesterase protein [Neospora caninum Liverpool]CBZ53112.1 glycerophosphoryl diester phosphodiesterase protein [Neospora caninum Liverpool]CEL67098.1 TPA: glycerophosphoryl diester phosphodiesterase protein, putative [Neospora caninum Liverpool]|eukprot:XP_003883144.1 glycerophosphoryl diester phosphodiesterase protein [Neospora caninum Liverpool]